MSDIEEYEVEPAVKMRKISMHLPGKQKAAYVKAAKDEGNMKLTEWMRMHLDREAMDLGYSPFYENWPHFEEEELEADELVSLSNEIEEQLNDLLEKQRRLNRELVKIFLERGE